jgi:hypothetical protein
MMLLRNPWFQNLKLGDRYAEEARQSSAAHSGPAERSSADDAAAGSDAAGAASRDAPAGRTADASGAGSARREGDQGAYLAGPRCSPDILGITPDWGLIVEAKLTVTLEAELQLLRYKAVCESVWPERRWTLVQVAKRWRAGVPYFVVGPGSWRDAKRMTAWHFQGA